MTPHKPGRKFLPPGERRSVRLEIVLTPSEHTEIERAAGRELAPFVRAAALRAARGQP